MKRKAKIINSKLHIVKPVKVKLDAFPTSLRDGDIRRATRNALINARQIVELAEFDRRSLLLGGDRLLQLAGEYVNLNFANGAAAADEDEGDLGDVDVNEEASAHDIASADFYGAVLSAGEAA